MTPRSLGGAALLVLGSLGCTSFPTIEANACGNVVLDPGEACDTIVEGDFVCRPPGAIEACHYDCSLKADGTLQACPPRYGCARDHVCRVDSGEYFQDPVPLSPDVTEWLSSTDFDGDGQLDLLSAEPGDQYRQSRFRVHYFSGGGSSLDTHVFPRVTSRPVSRLMNEDEAQDLLFATFRVGMVPGRADRAWLPEAFSSYRIPNSGLRAVNVRSDEVGLGTPIAAFTKLEDVTGIFVPDSVSGRLKPILRLSQPVRDLSGTPIGANVFEGVASPCDELVFAYSGDDHVSIVDPCEPGRDPLRPEVEVVWRERALERSFALPDGALVDGNVMAADMNGDTHLDVVVGTSRGPFVAFGSGEQLDALAQPFQPPFDPSLLLFAGTLDMPLALADLSGDGVVDYVFPGAVVISRKALADGMPLYTVAYENRGLPWTMAAITDLNANGFSDVVAATEGQPGVTFVNGSGKPDYVGSVRTTEGPVLFLTTGDLDGDVVQDFAYVEAGKPTEGTDFLSVAFGNGHAAPSVGQRVARVHGVEQLSTGVDPGFDALFTVNGENLRGEQHGALTLFEGSPDRLPLAPFALVTFADDGGVDNAIALAVVAGSLTGPNRNDVVSFGAQQAGDYSQWLLTDIASGTHSPVKLELPSPPDAVPVISDGLAQGLSLSGAALDLDGDAVDEVLWLLPEHDARSCMLLVYGIAGEGGEANLRQRLRFGEPCLAPELRVLKADNDSGPALAAVFGQPAKLHLFWRGGSGELSPDEAYAVPIPGDDDVRGFDLSPDGRRLAVITRSALFVVPRGGQPEAPAASGAISHPDWSRAKQISELQEGRSVAFVDPNQDGIPAIAFADAEGIRLFEALLE